MYCKHGNTKSTWKFQSADLQHVETGYSSYDQVYELREIKKTLKQLPKQLGSQKTGFHTEFFVILLLTGISLSALVLQFDISDASVQLDHNSKYVIENLRGDTIDTWKSWNVPQGKTLVVNFVGIDNLEDSKMQAAKNVILSKETIKVDNTKLHKGVSGTFSTFYLGWSGALSSINTNSTKFYIPSEFEIIESNRMVGDIVIEFVNHKDTDGYTGYTKSVVDGNQILKSEITIYDTKNLSSEEIGTILRHEFGHALGLAHSSDPDDLMHPKIETDFPYISGCVTSAIYSLYDGNSEEEVVCKK